MENNMGLFLSIITAIWGILQWKQAYLGRKKLEVAEEILVLIWRIKDEITWIRNPFSFSHEYEEGTETEADIKLKRYQKLSLVLKEYYHKKLIYRALFGDEDENKFKSLSTHINKLIVAINSMKRGEKGTNFEKMREIDDIVYGIDETDEFSLALNSTISILEKRIRSFFLQPWNIDFWKILIEKIRLKTK